MITRRTALGALAGAAFSQTARSRRELFVDDSMVDTLRGASLRLATPVEREIVLRMDRPHEGAFSGYFTVLHDGGRYRLYYRGMPVAGKDDGPGVVTCYAESLDGVHFVKPADNVILRDHPFTHNFCPLLDRNPKAGSRYKALAGLASTGLRAYQSDDGLRWKPIQENPVIPATKEWMFDSQNLAFWSEREGCYVSYARWSRDRVRSIARATSTDFIRWTPYERVDFGDAPVEHLYTNQIHPFFRAPQIYIGIAARFMPGRQVLTEEEAKETGVHPNYFKDTSDSVLLTSRGGTRVDRYFREAFLRPGYGIHHWVSRDNYPALNVVPTGEAEMSFYVNRHYGQPTAHLQRFSLRTDGFASLNAGGRGGELLTKPFVWGGGELSLNFATSAAGGVRIEVQTADGAAEAGLSLGECVELIGDRIEKVVRWKSNASMAALRGKPVRLLIALRDADVYSFRDGA